MDIERVRAEMERRFAAMDPRPWPPPRDPMTSPWDAEYSRVTDPAKYRIVHQRATAWAKASVDLIGAVYEEVAVPMGDPAPRGWRVSLDSAHRLRSPRPGTLPIYLLTTAAPQPAGMLSALLVALGRPGFEVERIPDCGCDACDSGSDDLLEQVDRIFAAALSGELRAAKGGDRRHEWSCLEMPGSSSRSTQMIDGGRGRKPWTERWEGASWL